MFTQMNRNGSNHATPPSPTPEQCLRILVKQLLKEKGLREVLLLVKQEYGYPLEINYKV